METHLPDRKTEARSCEVTGLRSHSWAMNPGSLATEQSRSLILTPLSWSHLTGQETEVHSGRPSVTRTRARIQTRVCSHRAPPSGNSALPGLCSHALRDSPLPPNSPGAPRPQDKSLPHPLHLQLKAPCELRKPFQLSSVYPGSSLPGPWASLGRWR